MKVYDEVSWHYPDGPVESLDAAKIHFVTVMNWLHANRLLSAEGEEAYNVGVDSDFSITSTMLTEEGNRILSVCYDEWIKTVDYKTEPSLKLFEDALKRGV